MRTMICFMGLHDIHVNNTEMIGSQWLVHMGWGGISIGAANEPMSSICRLFCGKKCEKWGMSDQQNMKHHLFFMKLAWVKLKFVNESVMGNSWEAEAASAWDCMDEMTDMKWVEMKWDEMSWNDMRWGWRAWVCMRHVDVIRTYCALCSRNQHHQCNQLISAISAISRSAHQSHDCCNDQWVHQPHQCCNLAKS